MVVSSLVAPSARALILKSLRNTAVVHQQTIISRSKTYFRSGAIKPMPKVLPFGIVGLFASVIPGLFIGAAISKSVANFLEENDLFVPDDDDDED